MFWLLLWCGDGGGETNTAERTYVRVFLFSPPFGASFRPGCVGVHSRIPGSYAKPVDGNLDWVSRSKISSLCATVLQESWDEVNSGGLGPMIGIWRFPKPWGYPSS